MTVLTKILAVAGRLLLAVLALLLWMIIVPRHFWVEYSKPDGLIVKMNIALFKIRLYPLPSVLKKCKNKKQNNRQTEEKEQKKNKISNPFAQLDMSFSLVGQIVGTAKAFMKKVFKALKFKDVSFTVPVYAGDILNTQKAYSRVTTAFYSLSIVLQKNMQLYYKSPVFIADFANRYGDAVYFYTKITASPILLLIAVFYGYSQYEEIIGNNSKSTQPDNQSPTQKEIKNG